TNNHRLRVIVQQKTHPQEIPVIDVGPLRDHTPSDTRAAAVSQLGQTLETVGFAYLSGHGIPAELVDGLRETAIRFHDLPEVTKNGIRINTAHRGFIPYSSSTLKTSTVDNVSKPNLSDSLMIMHELSEMELRERAGQPLQGRNQWPADVPELREMALRYMTELSRLGRDITIALAEALGLLPTWFLPHFDCPTLFLRLLHYPEQERDSQHGIGAAPHTDYGFITILAQDDSGGLEVRSKDGTWIAAPPIPDTFVMNVGDILSRWSNGRFASTPHRVINRSGRRRFSQPFFFDPSMQSVIECPSSLLHAGDTPLHPPVCWGDYLMERLNRNYTYRQADGK
ncbi:isopenicillin N synthase family dioxygenase, partial [Komagataeibacter rhaeticus]|uniref:isopenicillin N synthase family dioxygenase n=1 Tax=Komagataeibacter rhaeticus TaxID=215221 RepID=UPI0039ED77EA